MAYPDFTRFRKLSNWFELYAQLQVENGARGVGRMVSSFEETLARQIARLRSQPIDTELAASEPSSLVDIRKLRPEGPRIMWRESQAQSIT